MRRMLTVMIGILLLVVPAAVGAQDSSSKLLWDLDGVFTVTDLGFQFNYPKDWLTDTSNSIRVAENADDLAAIVDTDETTQAKGYTIALTALTPENLDLPADATLEDTVDKLVEVAGITETESRIEVPVMTHRSLTLVGNNSNGKPGLITVWQQDGYVVVFILGAPELTKDVGYSWGNILGRITPINTLKLNEEPLTSPQGDFTFRYPDGWFLNDNTAGTSAYSFAEIENDLTANSPKPEGLVGIVLEDTLDKFIDDSKDLDTLVSYLKKVQPWLAEDGVVMSESVILDQPAVTIMGANGENGWGVMTALVTDKNAIIVFAFAPTEEGLKDFMPTYTAMLQSITAVDQPASS